MIRSMFLWTSKTLGLFNLSRLLTRNQLRILGYHGIWFSDNHYGNYLFMSSEKFQSRMKWLKNSKYPVIYLDQAVNGLYESNLPPCSTVITIDDGWYGTYLHMLPILQNYGLPATLYVYTGAVDSQRALPNILLPALIHLTNKNSIRIDSRFNSEDQTYKLDNDLEKKKTTEKIVKILWTMKESRIEEFCRYIADELDFDYDDITNTRQFSFMSYEEIADANRRGLDIQLHTDSHRLNLEFPETISKEIQLNREKLKPYVNSSLTHFCYPGGINSQEMHGYLDENGVKSATLVDVGLATANSNRYALKRILDGQNVSQLEFEAELSGFMELLRKTRVVMTVWMQSCFNKKHRLNDAYGRKIGFIKHIIAVIYDFFGGYSAYKNIHWKNVNRLVFVCHGNICRSAYADTRSTQYGIPSASAGLGAIANGLADQQAIKHAAMRNIDMSRHRTTNIANFESMDGDLFICMEPSQAHYIRKNVINNSTQQVTLLGLWSDKKRPFLQDPYGLNNGYWNTCFDIIDASIENIFRISRSLAK